MAAGNRARLVTTDGGKAARSPEEKGESPAVDAAAAEPMEMAPERTGWLLILPLTLASAMAGAASAWLLL